MVTVNTILCLSSAWYSFLSFNKFFYQNFAPFGLLWKISEIIQNMIFTLVFFFTKNMIFPSIAKNAENIIFTLSVFSKILFFMQCGHFAFCLIMYSFSFFFFLNLKGISAWPLHANKRKNVLGSKILPLLSELWSN